MKEQDLLHLTLPGYILGSSFCVKFYRKEVCVFLLVKTYYLLTYSVEQSPS